MMLLKETLFMIAGSTLIWISALSFLRDIWRAIFLYDIRKTATTGFGIGIALLAALTTIAVLGKSHHAAAVAFAVAAITPWSVVKAVTLWAWFTDTPEQRKSALALRVSYAVQPPHLAQWLPWSGYLFDVERSARLAGYEPPPI